MGHTNYWETPGGLTAQEREAVIADVKQIIEHTEVPIEIISESRGHIVFNGVGDDSHETFSLFNPAAHEQQFVTRPGWFCKTNGKPYDEVVVASMMALKHHYPEANISADNYWNAAQGSERKNNALSLFQKAFPDRDGESLIPEPYDQILSAPPEQTTTKQLQAQNQRSQQQLRSGNNKYDSEKALSLRKSGYTIAEIAKKMGVSRSWVQQHTSLAK